MHRVVLPGVRPGVSEEDMDCIARPLNGGEPCLEEGRVGKLSL